jgi:hypothetical protein
MDKAKVLIKDKNINGLKQLIDKNLSEQALLQDSKQIMKFVASHVSEFNNDSCMELC